MKVRGGWVILTWMCVCCSANNFTTGFVEDVSITAHSLGVHGGYPAYYKDEPFNLTVLLHLNNTWRDLNQAARLVLKVTVPNNAGPGASTCLGVLLNGAPPPPGCPMPPGYAYRYYFSIRMTNVRTELSDGVQINGGFPVLGKLLDGTLEVDFGLVSLPPETTTTSGSTPGYGAPNITVQITGVKYREALSLLDVYTFGANVQWESTFTSDVLNASVDTKLQGPDLFMSFSPDYSDGSGTAQAGDTVGYLMTVSHTGQSTELASNAQVFVTFNAVQSVVVPGSVRYGFTSGSMTDANQTALEDGLISVNIPLGNQLLVEYTLSITDNVRLQESFNTQVRLRYELSTDSSRSYKVYNAGKTVAKDVTFQTVPQETIPDDLAVGVSYNLLKTFKMPFGSVVCELFAEIETTGTLAANPLSFNNMALESNSTDVVITSQKRRKRSIGRSRTKRATTTIIENIGTITNPSATGTPNTLIIITGTADVGDVLQGGGIGVIIAFDINGQQIPFSSTTGLVFKPILQINHTVEYEDTSTLPTRLRFNVTASHGSLSNSDALDVTLRGGSVHQQIFWYDRSPDEGPLPSDPELAVVQESLWSWSKSPMTSSDDMLMSYPSIPKDSLPQGITNFTASVRWKAASAASLTFTQVMSVCLERLDVETSTLVTEYGFVVLALICGIILGVILVLLILFIICRCCKRLPLSSIRPASAVDAKQIKDASAGHGLLLSAPKKKGFNTIKDLSGVGEEESIVGVLTKKDRIQIYRDLDTWDILHTINIDTEIENERDDAMMSATLLLMRNMQGNGDIDQSVVDKATQKFKKSLTDLTRRLDDDYKREIDAIYQRLSAKNQEKLADLLAGQQEEEEEFRERTKDLSPKEQEYLMELMKEQHETERSELGYRLKLEQDEETEKLRKEYAIKKRMGIKDAQQVLLEEVKTQGKLSGEQADWLMKEHFKNQAAIEKLYDDEISRQRMALEEKLARRRALARQHEQQDEFFAEELNAVAGQQMEAISKMKKEGVLSEQEAREMKEQAEKDLLAHKNKMDADRSKQEQELHKKLSERKRKRRAETAKKHAKEVKELEKNHREMQTKDGYCDPIAALQEKQSLLSHHRAEMNNIETELDKEHSDELAQLRSTIADSTRQVLISEKTKTLDKLKERGASEDQIARLLKKHEYEMENLLAHQREEKEKQDEYFKKQLAKRRQQFAMRREEEKQEQDMLREHEENIVRKLMDNQVAMSEDERERIMAEHEKQMVKLENSLTLNKLQQKRMLEEKLAQKRARQMEKLQKKQNLEVKKTMRKADRDSDMDEQDKYQTEMSLMTKHAEQRIAVMQGENIRLDDEMEEIRIEMMKQRASSLKEQEVKLGAMLAQLQMKKAKEMAKIEEQQKAIFNLKTNMMDDLNEKGLLSDPECQRVIEVHQREQAKLSEKLDAQRAKQERHLQEVLHQRLQERERSFVRKQEIEYAQAEQTDNEDEALRARLDQRLQQKEEEMNQLHEDQLRRVANRANTPAAKIRRVALKQKQILEMEKFRNRMEKEIEQTLQELRRQSELKRLQMIQDQELQFLNGLVRLGKFNLDELENVVHLLFPNKSEEETKKILDTLCEGYEAKPSSQPDEIDLNSSLVLRVKSANIRRGSQAISAEQMDAHSPPKTKRGRGRTGARRFDDEMQFGQRPEPVGRSYSPDYGDQPERRPPPNRLAPLAKKKKRRKAAPNSEDELYDN